MDLDQNTINLIMFAVMAGGLYFILIRPQQQRQREHDEMLKTLRAGDEVITAGGVFGIVTEVGEDVVTVELAKGVEVRLVKEAVSRKVEE